MKTTRQEETEITETSPCLPPLSPFPPVQNPQSTISNGGMCQAGRLPRRARRARSLTNRSDAVEFLARRHYQLAKDRKTALVTGDPEFKPLEKEIKIHWLRAIPA